jgi:hypothetical protein
MVDFIGFLGIRFNWGFDKVGKFWESLFGESFEMWSVPATISHFLPLHF